MNKEEKQYLIEQANNPDIKDISEVSDGYHTFSSLYNQRLYLFAALVNAYKDKAWKSRLHHDGEPCFGGGWFIVGITTPTGDYTYHYELKDWNLFNCKVLDKAPVFDGHTDKDVTRVLTLQPRYTSQWIPVEEELPKEKGKYMFRLSNGDMCYETYYPKLKLVANVTHWMPIVPPQVKEE